MTDELKDFKTYKYEFLPTKFYPHTLYMGRETWKVTHDHRRHVVSKYEVNTIKIERVVKDRTKAFNICINMPMDTTPEQLANLFSVLNKALKSDQ